MTKNVSFSIPSDGGFVVKLKNKVFVFFVFRFCFLFCGKKKKKKSKAAVLEYQNLFYKK
jgi:hypothetical protein